jgi:hypothetical protein
MRRVSFRSRDSSATLTETLNIVVFVPIVNEVVAASSERSQSSPA